MKSTEQALAGPTEIQISAPITRNRGQPIALAPRVRRELSLTICSQGAFLMSRFHRRSSTPRFLVRARHRGPRALRNRFAPAVDSLEVRALLSTLVVTNTNDSGPGSLRHEIADAVSGQTIAFSSKLRSQTITLASGELDVTESITI
jgi:hypothetical protein